MSNLARFFRRGVFVGLLSVMALMGQSQTTPVQLKLKDFAIWAGGGPANPCDSINQGVRVSEKATIIGNVGSQQFIRFAENLKITGNIYTGNIIFFGEKATVTGNVTANKTATTYTGTAITGKQGSDFKGNLTANGKISVASGTSTNISYVRGQVAVPAPSSTNYSGPVPAGGITNTFTLPLLPVLPNNAEFDSQVGTTTISGTQTISPGLFKKMALSGSKTLTFNGPGNYIFYEVANTGTNKLVFSFGTTTTGTINIFIIKDASWGKVSVSMTGSAASSSRIYTEIHGTGSANSGFTFDLQGPDAMPASNYAWLGNIWAPNGGITIKNLKTQTTPHILGAIWSGKKVEIKENLVLTYQAPANDPNFIDPYYPPPANGKVNTANNSLGAELYSLSQNPTAITSITDNNIFQINTATNKVLIEVISKVANDNVLKGQLLTLGLSDTINNGPHSFVITGYFPIANLPQLNTNTRIDYSRPLYPPIHNSGQVTTQGDKTMRSNFVRDRFGVDGSGVKVGVLSDSYNNKLAAQSDVDQGDLPGITTTGQPNQNPEPVQVLQDLSSGGNDEGRAMLQIVHDIAPKAKLAFRTGFLTAGDFAKGIQALADPNLPGGRCDVIVDDLSYLTEPFMQDGVVAKTVNDVVSQGVTYVTSAGNFGTNSYEAVFSPVTNTSIIATGQLHKYGSTTSDVFQTVSFKPGKYTIVLQWADNFYSLGTTGAQNDLDLYIVGTTGITLFGFNRNNINGDPVEVCPFTVDEETTGKIMVVRSSGTANVRFKYMILRGEASIVDYKTGTSTIVGHANSAGAITVGAMLYDNIPPYTPVWPGVASFSSRGGTNTLLNSNFVVRNKPDLIAPNGVNTTVNLGGASGFNDGDPYPNFFGTSAAAPHVGGVAALLIQARKKFALQGTVTPTDIRQQLITSAGKFSYLPAGFSFEGGNGYVQADSAIQQTANARPIIDTLMTTVSGAQNGTQPFELKVKGRYLTPQTQIYANGAPVTTTVSADKTMATATVPAIPQGQDPPYQLYNPAKSTSNLDGGLSEALHFFSSRIDVTVKATNKSRKYGLANPGFDAQVFINGIPIQQTSVTLADLKLDGNNISFTTIATSTSPAGLYAIVPSRTTPLANNDTVLTKYGFTFVSGTLTVEKMPLKITPKPMTLKYGEFPSSVDYTYELDPSASNPAVLLDEVRALHHKYLADNALVVLNGSSAVSTSDVNNMSVLASMQSLLNARRFKLVDGLMQPVSGNLDPSQIGDQRLIVDASSLSIAQYKQDSANANMLVGYPGQNARAFLNLKALANGSAKAAVPNGQLQPLVNGQLMAMVNGQLQAIVNGQLQAIVNGQTTAASDISFLNGQLMALVNGSWYVATNGQLQAIVNNQPVTLDLSVTNGQLQAIVNGQLMALVNGQLQAIVNGQLVAVVNGQLKALVNGQLMPIVNGQLMAMVNGQLQPLVNGQLVAMVNGQLMALVNGELQLVDALSYTNGQLQAIVNGQLQAIVNGQLKAIVNGTVTDIPTNTLAEVNGQLQAIVNGQLVAMVNGQLQAIVNGQLQPLVNGTGVATDNVRQLVNGQLQALVNNTWVPITNGQLMALVNGQLLAMVNGQLMAIVNGQLTFAVFKNGQLQALVNGQLQPLVNGQLQAIVNGQLQAIVNYTITNGQLQAIVNGQNWAYANGQLLALVNGQLQPLVNNFDVSGSTNNARTLALVDAGDITTQSGDLGAMFAVNMISGLGAGSRLLIPGAFVDENYQVTYGSALVTILPSPAQAKARDTSRVYGAANPSFAVNYSGLSYGEGPADFTNPPTATTAATQNSNVGVYPITLSGGSSSNYSIVSTSNGNLTILPAPLTAKADDKTKFAGDPNPPLTITYTGLVGDDTKDSICIPYLVPPSPKVIDQQLRLTTYTDVKLNGGTNVILATPGQQLTLTGTRQTVYNDLTNYCPGCITQLYIGMANAAGLGNVFTSCFDVSLWNLTGTGNSQTAALNFSFNAPTVPGVYYITQNSSWEYNCYDNGNGQPGNDPNNAIAVVVVGVGQTNIIASTTATDQSTQGIYPITLQGCFYYNPNYSVTLQDGNLNVVQAFLRTANNSNNNTTMAASPQATPVVVENKPAAERTVPVTKRVDKLYPNPTNSSITVQVADNLWSTADLEVYDRIGRVNAISFRMVAEGVFTANVAGLPKGIYLVKVKTGSGSKTFKFIKM